MSNTLDFLKLAILVMCIGVMALFFVGMMLMMSGLMWRAVDDLYGTHIMLTIHKIIGAK